jgi:hypothetical protein
MKFGGFTAKRGGLWALSADGAKHNRHSPSPSAIPREYRNTRSSITVKLPFNHPGSRGTGGEPRKCGERHGFNHCDDSQQTSGDGTRPR